MKAKYYLRGMGIGIFVTALIFGIALVFYNPSMSDEEIRREAAKLGMLDAVEADIASGEDDDADTAEKVTVENIPGATGSDSDKEDTQEDAASEDAEDAASTEDTADGEEPAADDAEESQDASEPSMEYQGEQKTTATTATESGSASSTGASSRGSTATAAQETASDTASSSAASGGSKSLTIRAGENSYTTAAHLYKDGLVDNASKFNTYLESNHYDVKILAGTFTIPEGSSYDDIVKIITGQK